MSLGAQGIVPNCDDVHRRLLSGDPVASADLFACYAASLGRRLANKFRTVDADLIHDAVVTALLDFADRPDRFDPSRRSLDGYLYMAAHGDLLNLLEKLRSRQGMEIAGDPVELETAGRNIGVGSGDPVGNDLADRDAAEALAEQAMRVARTEEERIVMSLMLEEERATEAFARALGLSDLPPAQQRQRVYAIKDRLAHRLRRSRSTAKD